jgi:L-fuconate dehydratase
LAITITDIIARDIRFPTSRALDGSDAMNPDPDYSTAYVILKTDSPESWEGHGLTFTIGRGNEFEYPNGSAWATPVRLGAHE